MASKRYPGEDMNMSNYGVKLPSPYEAAGHWKQCIRHETDIHRRHLSTKGNGTAIWPGIKDKQAELTAEGATPQTYYKLPKEHDHLCSYDRMFHVKEGYNSRLHRDDREHTVGLDILAEEKERTVPVLASSDYGRLVETGVDTSGDKSSAKPRYARVEEVMKGFYRCRGTGIPATME